ncbi:MAG: uncharacterized protein QOD75_347 [Blastocatellia bacterium]|jgi:uncharacterized protein YqjF (DUF2071 family)|nr:uncharacterized protein [Blastocatellia bacterium]
MPKVERLFLRQRPDGMPLMHQNWGKLLFMHWRLEEKLLRPLIPPALEIDTYDGSAWIAVTPFTMWGIRASFLPPIPGTSAFHELNVRTYVHLNGVPGVWFFSLDATNTLAVWAARLTYHLPYFSADMNLEEKGKTIEYSSRRIDSPAELHASWTIGEALPESEPESLQFFLTERYCLYSSHDDHLYRARIWHEPWSLRSARLESLHSTMIEAVGLPAPEGEPLLFYSEEIAVGIWPLEKA